MEVNYGTEFTLHCVLKLFPHRHSLKKKKNKNCISYLCFIRYFGEYWIL